MRKQLKVGLVSLLSSEQLRSKTTGWHTFNDLEPYGLESVGAVARQEGHEVKLFHPYQTANSSEEKIIERVINYRPDVLAISSLTNAFSRATEIASRVKQASQKTLVVVGGDHISSNPPDMLKFPQIDFGIMGEGETTFKEVLDCFAQSNELELKRVKGVCYVDRGELKLTPWRNRSLNRTEFPKPIRDVEIIKKSRVGALMYPSLQEQTGAGSVLFNFGCPLKCSYCTETTVGKGRVGSGSSDRVLEELFELKEIGANTAMMLDLTFNLYSNISEKLCKRIAESGLDMNWYAMIRVTGPNGKPMVNLSLLEAMAYSGCSKVGFGIESFDVSAERDYNRACNLDENLKIMKHLDRLGILSKALLMIGHPEETSEYHEKIKNYLRKSTPDEVRISFITPFPGTRLWNEMAETGQWELTTRDYNQFTTLNPIVKMRHFSPTEIAMARKEILSDYYTSNEFKDHVTQKATKFPRLSKSYDEFSQFLTTQNII